MNVIDFDGLLGIRIHVNIIETYCVRYSDEFMNKFVIREGQIYVIIQQYQNPRCVTSSMQSPKLVFNMKFTDKNVSNSIDRLYNDEQPHRYTKSG